MKQQNSSVISGGRSGYSYRIDLERQEPALETPYTSIVRVMNALCMVAYECAVDSDS
jgi:hypothetical protein